MTAARFLGRYELGERIGLGGVAEVIRATVTGAQGFAKTVVVKRVRDDLRDNAEVKDAFVREAELARRLVHGNCVQVLDLGADDDGLPYLVLELVDGCSLAELCERERDIPLGVALQVIEQIGAALQYVHAATDDDGHPLGLVHRDVTPKNILLSRDGVVKLTDFGIARATSQGSDTLPGFVKGTPQFLSPEQAAGRPVDERTDVYALGLVLRTMLPADADADLVAIVDAATEPAVRDRLPSAEAFVARLQAWRVGHDVSIASDRLAALVRHACGSKAPKRAIALDAGLRDDHGGAATRQVAAAPPRSPTRWPYALLAIAAIASIGALAWPRSDEDARVEAPRVDPPPERVAPSPPPTAPTLAPPPLAAGPPTETPVEPIEKRPRKPGRLRINVVPYAQVTVDGRDWGRTPIRERALSPGDHDVELYNPDSQRRVTKTVRIAPGEPSSIETW